MTTKTKPSVDFPTLAQAKKALRPFLPPGEFRAVKGEPHRMESKRRRDADDWREEGKTIPLCKIEFLHGCKWNKNQEDDRTCFVTSVRIMVDHGTSDSRRSRTGTIWKTVTVPMPKTGFNWLKVGEKIQTAMRAGIENHEKKALEMEQRSKLQADIKARNLTVRKQLSDRGLVPNYREYGYDSDEQGAKPYFTLNVASRSADTTLKIQGMSDDENAIMLDALKKIIKARG